MAIRRYLAMTAAEIRANSDFPPNIAWMACHFSPYCTGLSNLPKALPPDSLLILDDITPIHGHDPERIALQLSMCAEKLGCRGVLLDFQRPGYEEAAALVTYLTKHLPCPLSVSDLYAGETDCPVFVSAAAPSMPLAEHLSPWQGREIWLELARCAQTITLTETGSVCAPLPCGETFDAGFAEENLHCHYRIDTAEDAVTFTLWRSAQDLDALLEEAESTGVTTAVGLYQELGSTA